MSHGLSRAATLEAKAVGTPAAEACSASSPLPALPRYPSLYQINTRVWLTTLARELGRRATLDDIADAALDRLAAMGFDWIWLLSVWQTGPAGQRVSASNPDWRREFQETLPDLCEEDIGGSGFAITGYTVHAQLGGDDALARLRQRLRQRGLRLLLDFVPNHTGLDHPWVETHPEYYVEGTELDLARAPGNYTWVNRKQGDRLLAYGRDPYFPGWPDALQLNYANPATQEAMIGELLKIAGQCDGVRCDMAMLVLPDVFERTWGIRAPLFWPEATRRVRAQATEFRFMAEVYWDLEWTLQQQGFDYTYDKRLYDRLREGHARPVREHFHAGLDYQDKLARFLENHDEPRAAAVFSHEVHRAAAVITFLSPGLRFFHQGQFEGMTKRISPHLCRGPMEPVDSGIATFYGPLLDVLRQPALRDGRWQLLPCAPAWEGNWTCDCFVAFAWQGASGERLIVAVNFAPNPSQCYLGLPFADLGGSAWRLQDQIGAATYDREGDDLQFHGLYLDVPPWQAHAFSLDRR
jgi:glycosidase